MVRREQSRQKGKLSESKKRTLKRQRVAEVENTFEQYPNLRLVKVADGARDNWDFLSKDLPPGVEAVDFFHAA